MTGCLRSEDNQPIVFVLFGLNQHSSAQQQSSPYESNQWITTVECECSAL